MIQYKCGQCRAEMESPDVMKVEVCPSCGALNRVPSEARLGGTVCCARCEKDFARDDKVKLYNRELVCEKCAAFMEDIEKVVLPVATEEDLAAPPLRSVFSGPLGYLAVLFLLAIPVAGVSALSLIGEIIAADSVASCLIAVLKVAWCSFIIWVSVLFFRKKRIAPIAIVAVFIVQGLIGLLLFLYGFGVCLFGGWIRIGFAFGGIGGALIILCILWTHYFLFSKRVKETFVR